MTPQSSSSPENSSPAGWLVPASLCALLLSLSIKGSSLWNDEAFSAWVAAHGNLREVVRCLMAGDSSDQQMGLYYLYLHLWARVFGLSELALRTANIPFICLFSGVLVWSAYRLFGSRISWIAPVLLPFLWRYAGEARPYMAVTALSTTAIAALFYLILSPRVRNRATVVSIVLAATLAGIAMHMLFVLLVPPLILILFLARRNSAPTPSWRDWRIPAAFFALPYAALFAFLTFTFVRGVYYDYPKPGLRSTTGMFYGLAGFATLGPDRRFVEMSGGWSLLAIGAGIALVAGLILAAFAVRRKTTIGWLLAASLLSIAEVVVLSSLSGKQLDQRHLAAVVPIFLFLLMAVLSSRSKVAWAAMILTGSAWLTADIRALTIPAYQREDFRGVVKTALTLHNKYGGDLVLATDPVPPAYYGLAVTGPAPCYPLRAACEDAFREVGWTGQVNALDGRDWPLAEVERWLAAERTKSRPVIVVLQMNRADRGFKWLPAIEKLRAPQIPAEHGFSIALLNCGDSPGW